MAVVYKHIRNIDNICFYIGIGNTMKRAFVKTGRSIFWKNEISKYDYRVEIYLDNISFEEAKNIEIELILFYGRRDLGLGTLVNLTNGGDGSIGKITSNEVRNKISNSNKGRKFSKEHRYNLSKSLKGKSKNIKHEDLWIVKNKHIMLGENNKTSKKIIDTSTNKIFNCLRELSEYSGIKKSTLAAWLNGQNKNKSNYKYL